MSLTKINLNMIQTPLSGVLGGSNSIVSHNNAFVIGSNISTTNSDALYTNDLRVTGKIYGDGSTIDNIGVAFTREMWTDVALSGVATSYTPQPSSNNDTIATTSFVKFTIHNVLTASPVLSGSPTADTPPTVGADKLIANREYTNAYIQYVLDNSPALSGSPTADTPPTVGTDKLIANREYTNAYVQYVLDSSPSLSGSPTSDTPPTVGIDKLIANREYTNAYVRYALDSSPSLSGSPTSDTPPTVGIDKLIANREYTNAYVQYAFNDSPSFGGEPTAPTPPLNAEDNRIATAKFIKDLKYISAATRTLTDNLTMTPQSSLILGANSLTSESTFSNPVSANILYRSTPELISLTVFDDHGISIGDYITISKDSLSAINGTYRVLAVDNNEIYFENPLNYVPEGEVSVVNNDRLNIGIGQQALNSLTTGKSNLALGFDAGSLVTTSNNNFSIGNNSQGNNGSISLGVSTSANNLSMALGNKGIAYARGTALGHESIGGLSAVSIGHRSNASSKNIAIGFGANANNKDNAIVIGTAAEATGSHLALASLIAPLNNQTITDGRSLEVRLNDSIGYIPVYNSVPVALPSSVKDDRSNISSSATSGEINFDVLTQTNLYNIANATGNFTLNVRGSSTQTLDSILNIGESTTIRFYYVNGASAYSNSGFKIDNSEQSVYWLNNSTPTPLTRSINYYQYVIIKTGAATYNVFGSFGNFADSDPNFTSVSVLLHGDGTQGSQTISDSSNNNLSVTVGDNTQIDTSIKKFGTGSIKFDGTGDNLSISPTNLLDFGTGAFTIEFWYYISADADQNLVLINGDNSNPGMGGVRIGLDSSRNLIVSMKSAGTGSWGFNSGPIAANLSLNNWHFFAVNRNGSGSVRVFNDGILTYASTWAGSILSNSTSYVGSLNNNTQYYNGYIDDLRITKGVSRYSIDFATPSTPFPNQ